MLDDIQGFLGHLERGHAAADILAWYPATPTLPVTGNPSMPSEASVVGQSDAEWGEIVVAFIVARGAAPDNAELDGLDGADAHCAELAKAAGSKRTNWRA